MKIDFECGNSWNEEWDKVNIFGIIFYYDKFCEDFVFSISLFGFGFSITIY